MLLQHPTPKNFTRICQQFTELSAKYAEFPHPITAKFLRKFLDPDPDDLQNLMATSLSKDTSLVKNFYEDLISSFNVKLLPDRKTD